MELNYRKAVQDDAELLIEMYNAAFHADYIRYGECPAYGKTKEAMELSIAGFPKYIILSKEVPAGVISGVFMYYSGISGEGNRFPGISAYAVRFS